MSALHQKNGFTLIEMAITIAIIAVLAAMLLGAVMLSRKKARQTQCMSNLRQIGMGLTMYLDDYRQYPVATNMPSLELNDLEPIPTGLTPYVSDKVFRCPLDNKEYFENESSSYEWNTRLNGQPDSRKTDTPREALWDYEPFHGEEDKPKSRNILYSDGRALGF